MTGSRPSPEDRLEHLFGRLRKLAYGQHPLGGSGRVKVVNPFTAPEQPNPHGVGVVEIGGEQQTVSADTLIDSPARIPHRLLNPGDGVFRVLVVKTPKPTEATQVL